MMNTQNTMARFGVNFMADLDESEKKKLRGFNPYARE